MTPRNPAAVGGLHEACFGVPGLDAAVEYWRAFGFSPAARGRLDADAARALYGVHSAVDSVRLGHLDADHGLVRLMRWAEPLGSGIGLAPLRGDGSRWVGQFVRSALDVANHGAVAARAGAPVLDVSPGFIDLTSYHPALFAGRSPQPFRDPVIAVREYRLIQPLWRQALLERFGYDSPLLPRRDALGRTLRRAALRPDGLRGAVRGGRLPRGRRPGRGRVRHRGRALRDARGHRVGLPAGEPGRDRALIGVKPARNPSAALTRFRRLP